MHRSDRFEYTIAETAASGTIPGLLRYGVAVTAIDEEGKHGDSAIFYVTFTDRGDASRNEEQAIGRARNMAFGIVHDNPVMPD